MLKGMPHKPTYEHKNLQITQVAESWLKARNERRNLNSGLYNDKKVWRNRNADDKKKRAKQKMRKKY